MQSPVRIILTSTTGMTLNDRFSMLAEAKKAMGAGNSLNSSNQMQRGGGQRRGRGFTHYAPNRAANNGQMVFVRGGRGGYRGNNYRGRGASLSGVRDGRVEPRRGPPPNDLHRRLQDIESEIREEQKILSLMDTSPRFTGGRGGRGGSNFRGGQRRGGQFIRRGGGQRGNFRGGNRGRGGSGQSVSKEFLDNQLDQYQSQMN